MNLLNRPMRKVAQEIKKLVEMYDGNYFIGPLVWDLYFRGIPEPYRRYGGHIDRIILLLSERRKKRDFVKFGFKKFSNKKHIKWFGKKATQFYKQVERLQKVRQ